MKYTALLNLAGIHDAGLSDKTDVVDWIIIEYIADWYTVPKVTRRGDKVWINYRHLIASLPILGLKTKASVSRRITKLAALGLLSIERDDAGRLFAAIGQAAIDARCYRETRSPEVPPVNENQRGVDDGKRGGVNENQHSVNKQISVDNQIRKEAPPTGDDLVSPPVKSPPQPTDIDLPDWLEPGLWAMWCDERKAHRKKITPRAARMQIKKLAEYREQGFSPQAVIEHSIAGGYQGLYPPRGNHANNQSANQPYSVGDRVRANISKIARQREQDLDGGRRESDIDGVVVDPPF